MLKAEKVQLRAVEPEDLELMHQWENDPELWHLGRTVSPYSRYCLQEYIRTMEQDIYSARQLRFVIEQLHDEKKAIGYVDLYEFDPRHLRAGVGILIGDVSERKKHYATEALQILVRYSFRILHLRQLFCYIPENNQPSLRLFAGNGFRKAGVMKDWLLVDGKWIPVVIMQRINNDTMEGDE
jgi:diamine N-acetyltransferase